MDAVKSLLAGLPPAGSRRLLELWQALPERRRGQRGERTRLEQLRYPPIPLSEHWQQDGPWATNGTEQAIGGMQLRSRTVRGSKSWQGLQAGLRLTGSGWSWEHRQPGAQEWVCTNFPISPTVYVTDTTCPGT